MIPTALYIHIPWCILKCPYCDFNSHRSPETIPEQSYIERLLADLTHDVSLYGCRELTAIFIGGGTPSLLSGQAMQILLEGVASILPFKQSIEITMEANPGTAEQSRFEAYRRAGVNRLSLGIQSFCPQKLRQLGRIHNGDEAEQAIHMARHSGFDNINLDIMHGLPNQTIDEGLADLQRAIDHQPNHLSWYQLTLEPNTVFYKKPPKLPNDDDCALLEEKGFALLQSQGFQRYEISAFARDNQSSQHNLNYWTYGDYFGIGAGAHGKLTLADQATIIRSQKKRQPKDYLNTAVDSLAICHPVSEDERVFEFMLNTSRLHQPVHLTLFEQRTGLQANILLQGLQMAEKQGLIKMNSDSFEITALGRRFTNDLQAIFLPE